MALALGDTLPALQVQIGDAQTLNLSDLRGAPLVIYFYPKDATPGCTTEAREFRDLEPEFTALGCRILGVSRDSLNSHAKFRANECLPFDLVSDSDERLCQAFDVIKLKNMYGKQVLGIERSTFLFAADGRLQQIWQKVKAPGHAAAVLMAVRALHA